jgi:hypothetical protein
MLNKFTICFCAILASGCATPPGILKAEQFVHADAQAAAAFDNSVGLTPRANVILAIDAQVTACEVCLNASFPSALPPGAAGITLYEMGASGLAGTSGPAKCKALCEPVVIQFGLPIK